MEHWKNNSSHNLSEEIDGILYVEEWLNINQWDGYYQISNFGRAKSLSRVIVDSNGASRKYKGRILSQCYDKDGYLHICLKDQQRQENQSVHRLVGIHFIQNPENKPEVNHKKGIRTDNRAHQLEWSTTKENIVHSFEILKRVPNTLGKFGKHHVSSRSVMCCTLNVEFDSIREAEKALGLKGPNITMVCRGNRDHTNGLVFRYIK